MITLHHCPNSRSSGARSLLEQMGVPYELHAMDLRAGENRRPAYLAVNPLGKVPAIEEDGALITEQGAVFLYLADRFPEAGLAPLIGDPLRGPFLRWLFFYGSAFEPAVVDHAQKRDPGMASMSPYGTYEAVIDTLRDQLAKGPWLLGERLTAADILWGVALGWTMMFGVVPKHPEFVAFAERVAALPGVKSAAAKDAELAAAHEAARDKG